MVKLDALRAQLSDISEVQMQADGYAIWMLWSGDINPVVLQTLEDYGGVHVAEDQKQALWFFFSSDALLAAARLGVWARFNSLPLTLQIFPVRFKVDRTGAMGMIFDESLWAQNIPAPQSFQVWVHSAVKQVVEGVPGLSLEAKPLPEGMTEGLWAYLEADTRLPYQSSLGWFAVLRPVGSSQDKNFHTGWREFFTQVEAVLQRNKFRFTLHDMFLMFPLESLRQFKSWCRDYLTLVARLKEEAPEQYWPCVLAVVDRKGLNFNDELPKKSNVEWDHLTPDYPHMSMRNALVLGQEYSFHEVRFAPSHQTQDDWASVSLRNDSSGNSGSLPQLAPVNLILGKNPHCFYCGQRSHESAACPTRFIDTHDSAVWNQVAQLDFAAMRGSVREIDALLGACEDNDAKKAAVLAQMKENTPVGVMLKAYYDIVWPVQYRSISFFWRARNKDVQKASKDLAPIDNNPIWTALEDFRHKDSHEMDRDMQTLSHRMPKDYRLMSLRGFIAMERGELEKAEAHWKEAEMFSSYPVMQAWHSMLQARAMEYQGKFVLAAAQYDQVVRVCPTWLDAEYRKIVCLVKSGFSESALVSLVTLIDRNGHFFNKALLDPEMERGHIQVLACLYALWVNMEARAKEEEVNLNRMRDELATWFTPGHAFAEQITERIHRLLQVTSVNNYVAFQMLATGRVQLEKDIQGYVLQEARDFKNKFKVFTERLKVIHEESAWFPFPKALVEFNKSYNQGVANMNWALRANFHVPDAFRKAQMLVEEEAERLKKLEGRLKFLRIVRDSTLFLLSVAESFFWMEMVGIVLIFVIMPLLLLYGDKVGLDFAASSIGKEQWQVQKALFFVVTVIAAGIAGLRTIMSFERIREKILAKAKASAIQGARRKK